MFAVHLCDDGNDSPRNRTAALHEIELIMMEHDRTLTHADYGFQLPERDLMVQRSSSHLLNRHNFCIEDCTARRDEIVSQFSTEQKTAMATILTSLQNENTPNVHCVLAPAGCGKSWFVNGITWHLRAEGKIVINVAASALAATLLLNGSTAHSTFKIPIPATDTSYCGLKAADRGRDQVQSAPWLVACAL
jgi:hypothetical protein